MVASGRRPRSRAATTHASAALDSPSRSDRSASRPAVRLASPVAITTPTASAGRWRTGHRTSSATATPAAGHQVATLLLVRPEQHRADACDVDQYQRHADQGELAVPRVHTHGRSLSGRDPIQPQTGHLPLEGHTCAPRPVVACEACPHEPRVGADRPVLPRGAPTRVHRVRRRRRLGGAAARAADAATHVRAAGPPPRGRGRPRGHPRPARPRPVGPPRRPAALLDDRLRRAGDRPARRARHRPGRDRWYVARGQRLPRGGHDGARPGARPDRRDAGARQRAGGRHPRLRAAAVRLPVLPARDLRTSVP